MRTSLLVLGTAVVFAFTGVSFAADTVRAEFHFTRAQTSADQFRGDLHGCQIAAKRMHWTGAPTSTGPVSARVIKVSVSATALQSCMADKGYQLAPNGFSSGWMRASA